jgi:CzcA family heavy metal efflux pump
MSKLIRFSLRFRGFVLAAAGLLLVVGGLVAARAPVDVLPDLTAPSVTVLTEASGFAPEEVELLVTFPLESVLNGAPGVRRLRSVSGAGVSVLWVEFDWGQEVYLARQIVSERLQEVELPAGVTRPRLGPVSSIMGEITFLALTSETLTGERLRRIAETDVRRALLAIPGIAQVVPIGGDLRQYQVLLDPPAMVRHGVGLLDVVRALEATSASTAAGFHIDDSQEYLVRGLGRARTVDDLAATVVAMSDEVPVTVGMVGEVVAGIEPVRGTASYSGRPAVILSVQKQPGAVTLELTEAIDRVLSELEETLPAGVTVEGENFRQADFIEVAIHNVSVAMRDGAILVVLILLLFLGNLRATLISAMAIPLSLVAGVLAVSAFGATVNTMTLGGLTIAIGALVDDAIIAVENIVRRLRQRRSAGDQLAAADVGSVIEAAAQEVVRPILFATMIIGLVFLPLFLLPGMEGRLMKPLGLAYVAALAASLVVSLTVTPALAALMLTGARSLGSRQPWLMRWLIRWYRTAVRWAVDHPGLVTAGATIALVAALALVPSLGRSFMPAFNEGALTVAVAAPPGITLAESDALGRQVEESLLAFPEVVSTSRRTGRVERDEHLQDVNGAEIEVVLRPGRPKDQVLAEMRRAVATIPGVNVTFGQPISHRIDHMISGSKANLAVKIIGPDLSELRRLASAAEEVLGSVPGIVDLSNQEQSPVPQLALDFDRAAMARYGLEAGELARAVEALFQGTRVGEILEEGVVASVVVRLADRGHRHRENLANLPVLTAGRGAIRLGDVARVRQDLGPSIVRREHVRRVAVLTANVTGRDLTGTVETARQTLEAQLELPPGYRLVFGGQFESAAHSLNVIAVLSVVVLLAMYGLLFFAFSSHRQALIVLVNLPLAVVGGLVAVAIGHGVLSVASLLGFITLFGIATRNGVLMVTRYQQLLERGSSTVRNAVLLGSEERMAPVLMTALTAGLALVPLVLAGGRPGNEILSPMGEVILGGLLSSTALNLVVVPALFARWGVNSKAAAEDEEATGH